MTKMSRIPEGEPSGNRDNENCATRRRRVANGEGGLLDDESFGTLSVRIDSLVTVMGLELNASSGCCCRSWC